MLVQYQERSVEADRRLQEESIICPGSDSENSVLCPICQKYARFCLSCLLVCLSVDRVQEIMVVARGYCTGYNGSGQRLLLFDKVIVIASNTF